MNKTLDQTYETIQAGLRKLTDKIFDDLKGPPVTNYIFNRVVFKNPLDKLMVFLTTNEYGGYHIHIYIDDKLLDGSKLKTYEIVARYLKDLFREIFIFGSKNFYPLWVEKFINLICGNYLDRLNNIKFDLSRIDAESRTKLLWSKNIPDNKSFEYEFIKDILDPYPFEQYNFGLNNKINKDIEPHSAGIINYTAGFNYLSNGNKDNIGYFNFRY